MNLPDTSFWLALAITQHHFHTNAVEWLASQTEASSVLFCRSTQQSFLRLVTTAAVSRAFDLAPLTNRKAWTLYNAFMKDRRFGFVEEPVNMEKTWRLLSNRPVASAKMWMDSYLAAFSIAAGLQFITFDNGFKQYPQLKLTLLA